MHIGACADQEEDDEDEGLEVEQGGHGCSLSAPGGFHGYWLFSLINDDSRGNDVCWRDMSEGAKLVVLDTVLLNAEQMGMFGCP